MCALSDSVWCNYMQNFIGLLCSRCGHCQTVCGATACKTLLDCSVAGVGTVRQCVVQLHGKFYWTALQPVWALSESMWCNYMENFIGLLCSRCGHCQTVCGATTCKTLLDCSLAGVGTVRQCVVQLHSKLYWTAL